MAIILILLAVSILFFVIGIILIKNTHSINREVDKYNQELQNKNLKYISEIKIKEDKISNLNLQKNEIEKDLTIIKERKNELQEDISKMQEEIIKSSEKQEKVVRNAFINYCEILDNDYRKKEKEYDSLIETLKEAYSNEQLKLIAATDEIRADLAKIENTRTAALAAQLKEKEIKENISFYCLQPKQSELSDINKLERLKPELNNPRVLSMLIWSTYFQKPMTTLCNNILGTSIVCGIYKITNQTTNECYIGQSVNISAHEKLFPVIAGGYL